MPNSLADARQILSSAKTRVHRDLAGQAFSLNVRILSPRGSVTEIFPGTALLLQRLASRRSGITIFPRSSHQIALRTVPLKVLFRAILLNVLYYRISFFHLEKKSRPKPCRANYH